MPNQIPLDIAIAGHREVPSDWMSASQVRPFIVGDPAVVWLEHYGEDYGFLPDASPYDYIDFIAEKGRQFEARWLQEMVPNAVHVCTEPQQGRLARSVRETVELMRRGTPVIAQPALWWAPERIHGVPDMLVHTCWLRERFPDLMDEAEALRPAGYLGEGEQSGHYAVFDLKFTTQLDQRRKARDLQSYAAQIRINTYMLGHLQGLMPRQAFLIARDRVSDPLPVNIASELGHPLDEDLATIRDDFVEIKVNGGKYRPWEDQIVASDITVRDDRWRTAKESIARGKTAGGDSALLYQIGRNAKRQLRDMGYPSLASMLQEDPRDVPLGKCRGIGEKRARQVRAILRANQSGRPVLPPSNVIPQRRPFEFYVDVEYFSNVNVDFEAQWPTLEGHEMLFMIGIGQVDHGDWRFTALAAAAEDQDGELKLLDSFVEVLDARTDGAFLDASRTALYHWTGAELWQSRRAADRHHLPEGHPLRVLPWSDLQKVFLDGPVALPGALDFRLKEIARALGALDPGLAVEWPEGLEEGLRAMVMGWRAFEHPHPAETEEMKALTQYVEADCKALWSILHWLRSSS